MWVCTTREERQRGPRVGPTLANGLNFLSAANNWLYYSLLTTLPPLPILRSQRLGCAAVFAFPFLRHRLHRRPSVYCNNYYYYYYIILYIIYCCYNFCNYIFFFFDRFTLHVQLNSKTIYIVCSTCIICISITRVYISLRCKRVREKPSYNSTTRRID